MRELGNRNPETGKNAPGQRRAGSRTLFGASMFGEESDGTPDARSIYYTYPTSGDGAGNVIARLDHIAAAKNPGRSRERGDKFYVTGIPGAEAGKEEISSMSPEFPDWEEEDFEFKGDSRCVDE
jgi:hypothetical protein